MPTFNHSYSFNHLYYRLFHKVIYCFAISLVSFLFLGQTALSQTQNYLQGSFGYGFLDDFSGNANGATTTLNVMDDPTSLGFEGGITRMGPEQRIRIGGGYQMMDVDITGGTTQDMKIYSANAYYFLGDKLPEDEGLHPFVGAGALLVDYGGDSENMKFGFAAHAGAEMPISETITAGAKYSYIWADGMTTNTTSVTQSFDDTTMHLFQATATYYFEGGL